MARTIEARNYPGLADLLGGWFDQDYDLIGWELGEILPDYAASNDKQQRELTISDIDRFIATYGETDESLREAVVRVFKPDVIIEGWDGMTTRQWLLKVKEMIL